jgi:glucose-6-phosphate 1-epimerase
MTDTAASLSLPPGVTRGTDHGAEAVLVDLPAATAVLHLDGAHLTSWVPAGSTDLLWLSPISAFGDGAAIRGGIPLVAPWFGPGRRGDQEVKHGWVRNVRWELTAAEADGDGVLLRLVSPADRTELSAQLEVRIGGELSLDLTLTAGDAPLEVEAALHTYLAVSDVRQIRIQGLGGADFLDNTRGLASDVLPEGDLTLEGPTDRIIDRAQEVRILDPGAGRTIVSTPHGTAKTVVWNPWTDLVTSMVDIPDEAWPEFVCIEPAVAKEAAVALGAGESLSLGVTYRLES